MIFECPGSGKFKRPTPESVICPACGTETEIWTDENETKCERCGKTITRGLKSSCLDWCKHARECIGGNAYDKYRKAKNKKRGV